MEELKSLLKELGLPPAAVAVIIVATVIIVFFIKRALNRREKQETERRKTLGKYALLQGAALWKAYRKLYEDVDMRKLSQQEFLKLISDADELIMKPFTDYHSVLPEDLKARIYNEIHNDLAQFKPDPSFPHEIKDKAICALFAHQVHFAQKIKSLESALSKYK